MAEKRKRRWGDRKEGRYLRSLDPYNRFTPYIMSERNDTNVLFKDRWEISEAESYLRQKRREGMKGLGMLHVVVASYIRTIAKYPGLNRFVSGSRIYARNNIEFVMTVKKRMELDAGETSIKVKFAPTDTLLDGRAPDEDGVWRDLRLGSHFVSQMSLDPHQKYARFLYLAERMSEGLEYQFDKYGYFFSNH